MPDKLEFFRFTNTRAAPTASPNLREIELVPGAVRSHEIFHIAVLIGLAFHWSFIYGIADGRMSPITTEL